MRKRRVPSASREARYHALQNRNTGVIPSEHFIGLSLSGGKADKSSMVLLEYFPKQKKIFLSLLMEQIQNSDGISADTQIFKMIESVKHPIQRIVVDAPLTLPLGFLGGGKGRHVPFEKSHDAHIKWMNRHYSKKNSVKKPYRFMTPYTERCAELYLESELEEKFQIHHALGANRAPLTARMQYLKRGLKKYKLLETAPRIAFWLFGLSLGLAKSKLRSYRHWDGGAEGRRMFLEALINQKLTFIYEQDFKVLVEDAYAFDAFLCALTGLMAYHKQTDPRPKGFPKTEGWVDIPKLDLKWP